MFWRELRAGRKGLVIWSVGMFLLIYMSMFKFDTIAKGGQAVRAMFEQFPQSVQVLFGMNGLDISSVSGYYGILLLYIMIAAAIHAGMTGVDAVAREERDHTAEFLFPKPLSRTRAVTIKLLAGLVSIAVMYVAIWIGSLVSIAHFVSLDSVMGELRAMLAAVAVTQGVFFVAGATAAAVVPRYASRLVAALLFGGYIVYLVTQLTPALDWLRVVSPIAFFNARDVLEALSSYAMSMTMLGYGFCCLGVALLAILATYWLYNRRDLHI